MSSTLASRTTTLSRAVSSVSAALNAASATPANSTASSSSMASLTSATSAVANSTGSPVSGEIQSPIVLDTRVTAAFGILGAFLLCSGLALAFTGSAYRRLAIFLTTCYTLATVVLIMILHFGVEKMVSPPSDGAMVGFVFAGFGAGTAFGMGAVVFHRGAKVILPALAGFMLGLTIQSLKNDGLIQSVGFRYFLYLGTTAIAFVLGIIPRFHDIAFLISSAFLGALAIVLGIDCFTTQDLKEFFVFNLGFKAIFDQLDGHFPVNSGMQIELGVLLLLSIIATAAQIRLFNIFETKLKSVFGKREKANGQDDVHRQDEKAAHRISTIMTNDVGKFEHRYSRSGLPFAMPSQKYEHQRDASLSSMASSPVFHSATQTPKSATMPLLLPELSYSARPNETALMQQEILAPALSSIPSEPDSPVTPIGHRASHSLPTSNAPSDSEHTSVEAQIANKERDLEEIAKIRQSIGMLRDELRRDSSESARTDPFGKKESTHARSGSASTLMATQEVIKYASPRPMSQRAILVRHGRSQSQLSMDALAEEGRIAARPGMTDYQYVSSPSVLQAQRKLEGGNTQQSSMSHAYSASNLNRHSRQMSQPRYSNLARPLENPVRPAHVRSQSATTLLDRVSAHNNAQRIVTGLLDQHPSTSAEVDKPVPRSMTMDIRDLDAKHRKRLSEIQNLGRPTSVMLSAVPAATVKHSPDTSRISMGPEATNRAPHEKRRSTLNTGPTQGIEYSSATPRFSSTTARRLSQADELGRLRPSPILAHQASKMEATNAMPNVAFVASSSRKTPHSWLDY